MNEWERTNCYKKRHDFLSKMVYVIALRFLAQISTSVAQCSTIKKNTKFEKCRANFTHVQF